MSEKEAFYDAEIAPALMALAKSCQDNGISIAAMVEWEPGETGITAALVADTGVGIRLAHLAMKAYGNVDAIILALMDYGRKHGHQSICLKQLGVPPAPPAASEGE